MKLVSVAEMRAVEKEADSRGVTYDLMMEAAGLGLADVVDRIYGQEGLRNVTGLVGSGNNGGDTLVALTSLALQGWQPTAYLVRPLRVDDPLLERLAEAGGTILSWVEDDDLQQLDGVLAETEVLLDGIVGTGIRLPLRADIAPVLAKVKTQHSFFQVVAVDCPSGVDCDTGEAAPETIPANLTVCMGAVKRGLMQFPAFELVGKIEVVGLGLPDDLNAWQGLRHVVIGAADVARVLPERRADAHKGTFGTALIAAGSLNYTGSALLAGKAAYRSGAGLVRLAVPGPLHAALAGHLPEATWLLLPHEQGVISEDAFDVLSKNLEKVSALLVGPGFGMEDTTAGFIKRLAGGKTTRPAKGGIGFVLSPAARGAEDKALELPPLVIDADGLKLLAKVPDWAKSLPAPAVLTPHAGEMAVLTGLEIAQIQNDRIEIALKYAAEWGHVVVLKGALTVVASPEGCAAVIPVASAALARAGTGDVLAGLIVGLRAQGMAAYEAAWAGAWIHAQAGLLAADLLGGTAAVLAGDVLDALADVLEGLSRPEAR